MAPLLPHRLYAELARFWPLVSPVSDYAEEAAEYTRVLNTAARDVRDVLELGSGGGNNAAHLKRHFTLTLSDLSAEMLGISARLNPECSHVQGDMRELRLGRSFDAVFVHDAIDYMLSESDLSAVMATAFMHCRPGGLVLFAPDHTPDRFEPSTDCDGHDGPNGEGIRYLEWTYDPDPADSSVTTHYAFIVREADGRVESFAETHIAGMFARETWLRLLEQQGFRAEVVEERTTEERTPRLLFIGHRAP
jgi:SAM-dependent methyltransferase